MLSEAIKNFQAGKLAEAEEIAGKILTISPDNADAMHVLGATLMQGNKLKEAEEVLRRAVKIKPRDGNIHNTLAMVLRSARKHEEAIKASQKALETEPDRADFLNNIGVTYKESGNATKAMYYYERALERNPNLADAYMNIGIVHNDNWNFDQAVAYLKKAVSLNPHNPLAFHNLATAMKMSMDYEGAITAAKAALSMKPELKMAWINLAESYYFIGDYENAKKTYDLAIARFPNEPGLKVQRSMLLPHVPESNEHIDRLRQEFVASLERLMNEGMDIKNPEMEYITIPFYLGYHGRNNKDIMVKMEQFFRKIAPSLTYTAPHCNSPSTIKKNSIKIGFVSKYFHNHTVNNLTKRIVLALADDKRFEVILFYTGNKQDDDTDELKKKCRMVSLNEGLEKSREVIAKEEIDILFYQELGMNIYSYLLAFARLAPVQVLNVAGHPMTSGLSTIDYVLTSQWAEPENAQEYYTEKVILLKTLPIIHGKVKVPEGRKNRQELGLPEGRLYCWPALVFRMHPDLDGLFREILEKDKDAKIIMFDSDVKNLWRSQLEKRYEKTIPEQLRNRIIFLPFAKGDDFIQILRNVDAIIDILYFSLGGTLYKTFADGLPIVVFASEFIRGRSAYFMYKKMGIDDLIAHDLKQYAALALRLAQDKDFHNEMSRRIRERAHVLYEDYSVVDEIKQVLEKLYQEHIEKL